MPGIFLCGGWMVIPLSFYLANLKSASKRMLRFAGDDFVRWVPDYFARRIKSRHISVALYDSARKTFPIQASSGDARIPPRFIAMDGDGAVARWFRDNPGKEALCLRTADAAARGELKRYRSEMCLKIAGRAGIAGYLLIGPRSDAKTFDSKDKIFLKTIANDIALQLEKEKFKRESLYDSLTGLLNRGAFNREFPGAFEAGYGTAVAMVDVDNFKKINDTRGHAVGDQVLRIAAERIRNALRKQDRVFRYGGEEIVILIHAPSRSNAKTEAFRKNVRRLLERVRKAIAGEPFECPGGAVHVTVSIGVCIAPQSELSIGQDALEAADRALYVSKKEGKNRVTLHSG